MTLQEVVASINAKATNYSPNILISFINMILDGVYAKNSYQSQILIDGMPPILPTEAGENSYEFPKGTYSITRDSKEIDVNVRETVAVFTSYYPRGSYGKYNTPSERDIFIFNGTEYYRIPIRTFTRSAANEARVEFLSDPGDSTDKYYHLFHMSAPKIESFRDEIWVPEGNDFNIIQAVLWVVKNEDFGDEKSMAFIENIVKKIQTTMNKGQQNTLDETTWRPEDRRYESYST